LFCFCNGICELGIYFSSKSNSCFARQFRSKDTIPCVHLPLHGAKHVLLRHSMLKVTMICCFILCAHQVPTVRVFAMLLQLLTASSLTQCDFSGSGRNTTFSQRVPSFCWVYAQVKINGNCQRSLLYTPVNVYRIKKAILPITPHDHISRCKINQGSYFSMPNTWMPFRRRRRQSVS
jgi:hypothetical protein